MLERRASSEDQAKPQRQSETVRNPANRSSEIKKRGGWSEKPPSRIDLLTMGKTPISPEYNGVPRPLSIEQP